MDDLRTWGLPLRLYADEVNLPDTIRDQCFIWKVPETLKWLLYGTPRQHVQATTVSESNPLVWDRAVMARTWVPLTSAHCPLLHSCPINTPHSLPTSKHTIAFLLFITLYSLAIYWLDRRSDTREEALPFTSSKRIHRTSLERRLIQVGSVTYQKSPLQLAPSMWTRLLQNETYAL